MKSGRMKGLLVALVSAAMPLVTTATCKPNTGAFDFFRDDGSSGSWEDGELFYQEDVSFYGDPYYYDDPYYNDGLFFEDCGFCF